MQVHSIISNTISEEILETGHLSIRFMADGFSLLLEDSSFKPIILNRFSDKEEGSLKNHIKECTEWLERQTIIENLKGELSIIFDSSAASLVPEDLFDSSNATLYLEQVTMLKASDSVGFKHVKGRPFYLVFAIPQIIKMFAEGFAGSNRIMHSSVALFSVADQIDAADHQRGFALIDVQCDYLNMLYIKEDKLQFANQLCLKNSDEYLYHTLNSIQQSKFDRRHRPLYYSGIANSIPGTIDSLKKYIKDVYPLSYFIEEIDKEAITEHILLAEATKCE